MPSSSNGWSVYTGPPGYSLSWITGRVRPGDVAVIFEYLCRRYHAEVEPIRRDWSWGWAYRPIRGSSSGYSNHASGTALDLNAPRHPLGRRGTFTGGQVAAIRRILGALDGSIRWGGDYRSRADEMHFEVNASAAAVAAVAARIRGGDAPVAPPEEDFDMNEAEARKLFRDELEKALKPYATKADVREAVAGNKLNVGKQAKWSDDTAVQTMLARLERIEKKVTG